MMEITPKILVTGVNMEALKYGLGESKEFDGKTFFRVIELVAFSNVSAGEAGGKFGSLLFFL